MNNRLKNRAQRLDTAAIAFVAIPVLLYIPVLHYSLNTPFGLVDDYIVWRSIRMFDWWPSGFYVWINTEFFGYDWGDLRYRPFWEFYSGTTWRVFGPIPWLHHIARWAMHLGAVAAFAAAFLCFQRRNRDSDSAPSNRVIRLLPLTTLVYLWLFFPNQPAAKLSPQEVQTVFFLAICAWTTALTLTHGNPQSRRSALLIYATFCIGFCGLVWTKETNIAAALWLLVSYYALLPIAALRRQDGSRISAVRALKGIGIWKALGGLPLIAVFLHTLIKVYVISQVDDYGRTPLRPELIADNAAWIAEGLFQVHTSLIITAGLALLSAALLLFVAVNIAKKRFSDELVFTLFLLGIFASLYLILCASPYQALRYWYVLIPVFTALLAFSAKFILEFAAGFHSARAFTHPRNLAAYALTGFIAFFVCCNYYNFLYQTAVQHISRHNEANLISEMTRLLAQERHVQILDISPGYTYELAIYFHEFLPRFYGESYAVRSDPPQEAGQPYHIVRHIDTVSRLPKIEQNYRPLAYARRIANSLQSGGAHHAIDGGAGIALWQIYDNEFNRIWWNGDTLDIRRMIADAGSPIIRSDFDVYLNAGRLIYINNQCAAANLDNLFFLGVFPVDSYALPEAIRAHGFENFGFDFANHGFIDGERCFAVQYLPEYPIKRIHTGQFIAAEDGYRNTWEGDVVLPDE